MDVLVDQGPSTDKKEEPKQVTDLKTGESMVLQGVKFAPNEVALTDSVKQELDLIIAQLKSLEGKGFKVEIGGHTDKSGLEELNILLSQQRAEAVYNYFLEQGVAPASIIWKGYGSEFPIETNKYQWGREVNRRIEIKLISKANS